MLGFTPLPLSYFVFVAVATVAYLLLVEIAKRILLRKASDATKPGGTLSATA